MAGWVRDAEIAAMSYNQLGKALTSGVLTEKRIKSYYTDARRKAVDRLRRVSSEEVMREFGNEPDEHFTKLRNLKTTSDLLHEVADVNRFLKSKSSTITGLKEQRQNIIDSAAEMGFDVDVDNYAEFYNFMKWFKKSEFAMAYDSDSEEVMEVFNAAESASPEEWTRLFNEYKRMQNNKRERY
jgi:hypothetical protein